MPFFKINLSQLSAVLLIRLFYREDKIASTDRQTDRQGESNIPPLNFVCGGIKTDSDGSPI